MRYCVLQTSLLLLYKIWHKGTLLEQTLASFTFRAFWSLAGWFPHLLLQWSSKLIVTHCQTHLASSQAFMVLEDKETGVWVWGVQGLRRPHGGPGPLSSYSWVSGFPCGWTSFRVGAVLPHSCFLMSLSLFLLSRALADPGLSLFRFWDDRAPVNWAADYGLKFREWLAP